MRRTTTRGARSALLMSAALSGLAPAACGEGTGPIEIGPIDAILLDNPASEVARLPVPFAWLAHHKSFGEDYYHGALAVSIELQLSTDGVEYITAATARTYQVALQDEAASSSLFTADLPAGSYRHVRLILREAVAALEPGAEIGGSELEQAVALPVEPGLAVTADARLDRAVVIASDRRSALVFDLNTERWVTEDHVLAGRVPGVEVSTAVSVGVGAPAISPSPSGA